MTKKKKYILIFIIFIIIIAIYLVIGDCYLGGGVCCYLSGGVLRQLPDTCVDDCVYNAPIPCGLMVSPGCDCGLGKCWNGIRCVENPLNNDYQRD